MASHPHPEVFELDDPPSGEPLVPAVAEGPAAAVDALAVDVEEREAPVDPELVPPVDESPPELEVPPELAVAAMEEVPPLEEDAPCAPAAAAVVEAALEVRGRPPSMDVPWSLNSKAPISQWALSRDSPPSGDTY